MGLTLNREDAEQAWAIHIQAVVQRFNALPPKAAAAVMQLGVKAGEMKIRAAITEIVNEALLAIAADPFGDQA